MGNATYRRPERETEALTFGRYELTRKLSQGGMAEIYLARQSGIENFEKLVVVKIVLPTLAADDAYEEMLLNEARMAARLNHPNIVQILDLGKLDGRFFIAMEYLEGENLLSIVQASFKAGRRLPVGFVCRAIADVLSGLEYAHSQVGANGRSLGIIHRDISPPNVIVTYAGTTKIVDFGIAKATRIMGSDVTNAGQFKGKVAYMSPEQLRRQPLDGRTDIFSTGVLLWELVTGKRLFRRGSDLETVHAVLDAKVPPASALNPDCAEALDRIIARALERSVHDRYPSARAMRKALEELIRQKGWSSDSLTMQRVMSDLFAKKPPAWSAPAAPVAVAVPAPADAVLEIAPPESTIDSDPTTRIHTAATESDDTVTTGVVIEITAAFESRHRQAMRGRRLRMRALGAAIGLVACGAGMLGWSMWRSRHAAAAPAAIVASADTSPGVSAATPPKTALAKPAAAAAPSPAVAMPAPPPPTRARVEVRVDAKAIVTLDGDEIAAGVPIEVDPSARHTVSVQRVGHHTLRTLELPRLQPGQHFVVGLWLRGGLAEAKRVTVEEAQPSGAGQPASAAGDAEPVEEAGERTENPVVARRTQDN